MKPVAERAQPIYTFHRALEMLAKEGTLFPLRLFSLFFPLYQVKVRGRQRRAEDYEELEWFFARGIEHARLDSVALLGDFYGLEEYLVRKVVEALKSIGHLVEEGGRLRLTPLGRESLQDGRRYELYESLQILYLDAFTCQPLPRTHYRLRFFAPGELQEGDRVPFSFNVWRPEALTELAQRSDRAQFNVPDEVQSLEPLEVNMAYLPMHVVEAQRRDGDRELRVYSNIRGRRDDFFEKLMREHPEILESLLTDHRPPEEVITYGLKSKGLPAGSYHLDHAPGGEWRVTVPDSWLQRARRDGSECLLDLGDYILAADYCVRVWSTNPVLRRRAALEKVLIRLERARQEMLPDEVRRYIEDTFARLEANLPEWGELAALARQRGLGQALERLESARSNTEIV